MCEFYGLEHGELHRADEDALMTGKLLLAMMADKERVRKAKRNSNMAKDFDFEITEHIGVLAEKTKGWKREINLVSWGGAEPKIDIRDWSPDHSKMGKGITLTAESGVHICRVTDGDNARIELLFVAFLSAKDSAVFVVDISYKYELA